jgi:ribose-phosphate pyrophosphokinase
MFDDMISTAGTVCEAARLVTERGARDVIVAATHPVLVGLAMERLADSPISKILVSDSIPEDDRYGPIKDKIETLSVAPLLGEAVHRIHHDQSVSAMFRSGVGTKR